MVNLQSSVDLSPTHSIFTLLATYVTWLFIGENLPKFFWLLRIFITCVIFFWVDRIGGLLTPLIRLYSPQALHKWWPVPSRLHNGVTLAAQFTHSLMSIFIMLPETINNILTNAIGNQVRQRVILKSTFRMITQSCIWYHVFSIRLFRIFHLNY